MYNNEHKHKIFIASQLSWPFIHSIAMCRMRRFLAVLRSFFHSSLLHTFSCHPSPPTILPSSLTSSCHLFLGLPLNLVVPKVIYNTLLGIQFPSILCKCSHNAQFPAKTPLVSSLLNSPLQLCLTQPHILLSVCLYTTFSSHFTHMRLFCWDTHIFGLLHNSLSHIPH